MSEQKPYRGKPVTGGPMVYGEKATINEIVYIFIGYGLGKSCSCCDTCDCRYDSIHTTSIDEVIPSSVGQSTGKIDAKGTPVWEHDIGEDGGVIVWNDGDSAFLYDHPDELQPIHECDIWLTVIGNTTDNPKLLEK